MGFFLILSQHLHDRLKRLSLQDITKIHLIFVNILADLRDKMFVKITECQSDIFTYSLCGLVIDSQR